MTKSGNVSSVVRIVDNLLEKKERELKTIREALYNSYTKEQTTLIDEGQLLIKDIVVLKAMSKGQYVNNPK